MAKWEGMKEALAGQNVEEALTYFTQVSRELYNEMFTALRAQLPQIAQEMQNIQFIHSENNTSKYRIREPELYDGQTVSITYYIYFVLDKDGIWRIYKF
jgi:predicted component of type VI protein secretion system